MREKVGVPVNIVKMRKGAVNSTLGKMEQKVRLCRPYNLHAFGGLFVRPNDGIGLDNICFTISRG
jgi:hypothetical protein